MLDLIELIEGNPKLRQAGALQTLRAIREQPSKPCASGNIRPERMA
jgi:hypothetical protein